MLAIAQRWADCALEKQLLLSCFSCVCGGGACVRACVRAYVCVRACVRARLVCVCVYARPRARVCVCFIECRRERGSMCTDMQEYI